MLLKFVGMEGAVRITYRFGIGMGDGLRALDSLRLKV